MWCSRRRALFSTLTVAENVQVPLREFYPELPPALLDEIASYKVTMSGLPAEAGPKYPSELSGGMTKRVALARSSPFPIVGGAGATPPLRMETMYPGRKRCPGSRGFCFFIFPVAK